MIAGSDKGTRPGRGRGGRVTFLRCWILVLWVVGSICTSAAVEGLPLTRFYPFEEIGRVSRGAQLSFDALGRVVVVQQDEYVVLNDNVWLRLSSEELAGVSLYGAKPDLDGTMVYGALGSWGFLTPTPTGQLRPRSLVPASYPKWVLATNFDQILCRPEGIYFAGWNGVVFWDRNTGLHLFFEVPGVTQLFLLDDTIFVSSHDRGVLAIDSARQALVAADQRMFGGFVIGQFATSDPDSGLMATTFRRLLMYRAGELKPLPPPLGPQLAGGVTALQSLSGGGFAVSVTGIGLHILDAQGRMKLSLTGPEYLRITALANREPGVLWAANETGVIKILYDQPFTRFGQTLGLPVSWPQVVSWNGQIIIASSGRLYSPISSDAGGPAQFQQMPGQPAAGAWGIATVGDFLLVSNDGVSVFEPGIGFTLAVPGIIGARLVSIDATTCIVIGADEIAAVQYRDGRWSECAPRIPGVGYPAIVHAGKNSAWIELGVNRAARISVHAGRLESRIFETFPWSKPSWVNISVLGTTVVLAGPENQHMFFDEELQTVSDAPQLAELFRRAPYPIMRICQDETGTFWGSHQHGLFSLTLDHGRYTFDSTSYAVIDERVPLVQSLPGGDIWVSTGQSLYHLNRARVGPAPSRFQPLLVAVRDSRTNTEILHDRKPSEAWRPLRHDENNLTFQFFAGSYASMRPPIYEYRLNDQAWEKATTGSFVALTDLRGGAYRFRVRLADSRGLSSVPQEFEFVVSLPWFRKWYALASYPLLAAGVLFGLVRLSMRRAESRNAALETLVSKRTSELNATMLKLEQETRTSATLAERNRLAGEIHDSLEQGFTGLTLQLETTASFATCPPEVKSGLAVALNMVAFSRNEVRHAVRDMHSPMLASADLETALKHIITQVAPTAEYATIKREGAPRRLSSTIEHHLLRIAQEAIANAVKHAGASHLEIVLSFRETEVQLEIRDDGRGFEPEAILNGGIGHFGLPSFRGRASKIGGTVSIASRPGAGTRITVCVPVETVTIL